MPTGPTVYLETFGCQMNELDSELVRGHLGSLGYRFTDDWRTAEIVLYNTCSVREQAENKAYSRLGLVGLRKKQGEQVILGVLGCMAERDGPDMLRRFPQVDLLVGPGELDRLPAIIDNLRRSESVAREERLALAGSKSRRSATLAAAEDHLELLDLSRAFDPAGPDAARRSAYVRITRGCNKFCTYCVVPHTRGAEVHRTPDAIVDECRRLVDSGVIEITLLGQTVNHYRYTHGAAVGADGREQAQVGPGLAAFRAPIPAGTRVTTFAGLLHRIHEEVPSLQRLRFVTSYPRDFGDDVLDVMAACPRICRYVHAPAQSGSDRILKAMNRGYTRSEYLEFAARLAERLPDCTIAGDVIVGFPTETDADFEQTVSLVRTVPFKNNFIFKYSPRPGTVAIDRFADDVPTEVKKTRNNVLLDVQTEVSAAVHARWVGREVAVLVEQIRETAPARTVPADGGADECRDPSEAAEPAHPESRRIELRWERRRSLGKTMQHASRRQAIGRTPGDLIVAIDLPDEVSIAGAESLVGSIQRVLTESSSALLLKGRLLETALAGSERGFEERATPEND